MAFSSFWHQCYQTSQEVCPSVSAIDNINQHSDLSLEAMVNINDSLWLPSPMAGVSRKVLERQGGEQTLRATSLVAYQPGSVFSSHLHPLGEEILVLDGVFSDEQGDYPAGSYLRNGVGSAHAPFSEQGCLLLVKLQQFAPDDRRQVRQSILIDPTGNNSQSLKQQTLFEDYETVAFWHTVKGSKHTLPEDLNGFECLVISGQVTIEGIIYTQGQWLRLPIVRQRKMELSPGSQLWVKIHHIHS